MNDPSLLAPFQPKIETGPEKQAKKDAVGAEVIEGAPDTEMDPDFMDTQRTYKSDIVDDPFELDQDLVDHDDDETRMSSDDDN